MEEEGKEHGVSGEQYLKHVGLFFLSKKGPYLDFSHFPILHGHNAIDTDINLMQDAVVKTLVLDQWD